MVKQVQNIFRFLGIKLNKKQKLFILGIKYTDKK